MAPETVKAPHRGNGGDLRKSDLAINSEHKAPLADLQASHLTARFGFVVETAAVIASLAWGVTR